MDFNAPVSAVGEQALLQHLQGFCPAQVVGDDAAVLPVRGDRHLVVTSDVLVDGVHFSVGGALPQVTMSFQDVGWRATAANLSDLAAMGATPLGLTVSLGLPPNLTVGCVDELYQGITACLQPFQTPILGGDLSRSPILTVAMTALGDVVPSQQILRSTAQPGDAIVVTGEHGASRAGLELLLNPTWGQALSPKAQGHLKTAHQRPVPRLDVPPLLRQIDPALRVAGMDSSDGLADAVLQICRASGVGAVLERDRLPLPPALQQGLALSESALMDWVLYGGEDFELVLCLPHAPAKALVAQLGGTAAIIGYITAEPIVLLDNAHHPEAKQILTLANGFQHFGDQSD